MLVTHLSGKIDANQFFHVLSEQPVARSHENLRWLIDLRLARFDADQSGSFELAQRINRWLPVRNEGAHRIALLVTDDLSFGNSRVLRGYLTDAVDVLVSRCESEAMTWINRPDEHCALPAARSA